MNMTVHALKKMEGNGKFYDKIKIGVLTFGDNAKWVTNSLEDVDDFIWDGVEVGGAAALGAALRDLNEKMSRSELFTSDIGHKIPIMIFINSSLPSDDWKDALEDINKNNKWFRTSTKIAIALGEQTDSAILAEVVDNNPKAVISVNDMEMFESLMLDITVTAVIRRFSMIDKIGDYVQRNDASEIAEDIRKKFGIKQVQIDELFMDINESDWD